ncbi:MULTISPECIES: aminotransferase class V-fold PLP-dependent enzyme [unclassified Devosia]|uniref:aminotransferase class V-fold PLP-dependent enzyme n=1 Tax=unclassified Devosia TaxID=196773 RepID=UPI000B0946A4|nr:MULTISPECIES: aminotransferase class V-fold PLP-dependent enzyme [unclassified Devosia]MBN9303880.1 aminotransferase class V-fold PLP-dependent enzyme [Devosia sp.]
MALDLDIAPGRSSSRDRFLAAYPAYAGTSALDALRAADYARLDDSQSVYLDFTGAGLPAASHMREHTEQLANAVFGNPHSASPSSSAATAAVERTRARVLDWFNGAGAYTCVFTLNASNALKLVGEAYPFAPGGRYLLTTDNHNSVNGIREFASAKGAAVDYAPLTVPELRIDQPTLMAELGRPGAGPRLFAFPAQSNFSGVKHPLALVGAAQARGWHVLLDAAAFVPGNRLDLAAVSPDFVVVSFYKMFGYPTGVGCLLIRNDVLPWLERPWFAGGTVNFASVLDRRHVLAPREAAFEDGTLNFLAIPAVEIGLRRLAELGMETIQTRIGCLTDWLLGRLLELRHGNGRPMVRLYGPATCEMRGGTVTMNFYDPDGHLLDYRRIDELAGAQGISLRTGCFCNPGAGETAEGLTEDDMRAADALGPDLTLPRFLTVVQHRGKSAGAIRVSLGAVSNFADVERFLDFAAGFRDQTALAVGAVSFDIETCRVIRDGG